MAERLLHGVDDLRVSLAGLAVNQLLHIYDDYLDICPSLGRVQCEVRRFGLLGLLDEWVPADEYYVVQPRDTVRIRAAPVYEKSRHVRPLPRPESMWWTLNKLGLEVRLPSVYGCFNRDIPARRGS